MLSFIGRDQCLVSQDWSALLHLATLNQDWGSEFKKDIEEVVMGLFVVW